MQQLTASAAPLHAHLPASDSLRPAQTPDLTRPQTPNLTRPQTCLLCYGTMYAKSKSGIMPCRAACAVMGFVGTWVGQALIGGIGLLRTGVCALLLQAGSLALAALIYRSVSHHAKCLLHSYVEQMHQQHCTLLPDKACSSQSSISRSSA